MVAIKIISGDGTGDYSCDGSDDQIVINKALKWAADNPGNQIHLSGGFTYGISDQIFIGSNTVFSGDPTAVLKVSDKACGTSASDCVFPDGTTVIASISGDVPKNIEIYGFEFDGNCQNQSYCLGIAGGRVQSAGSGVERLIGLRGKNGGEKASNIKIHDMNFHDSFGEAAHIAFAENVQIYNNSASNHQHDAFFMIEVSGDNALHDNIIEGITDGCARLDNCKNWKVYKNKFLPYTGNNNNLAMKLGHNCMQIANEANKPSTTDNIEIYDNEFVGPNLCGIWINDQLKKSGLNPQVVRIHNNTFKDCAWFDTAPWSVGINVGPWGNGVTIDNNSFDGCYNNSIQFNNSIANGCITDVYNNNIINTKGARTSSGTPVSGYGIANTVPSSMRVVAKNNYMKNNKAGNYYNVNPLSESPTPISESTPRVKLLLRCKKNELDYYMKDSTQKFKVYEKV